MVQNKKKDTIKKKGTKTPFEKSSINSSLIDPQEIMEDKNSLKDIQDKLTKPKSLLGTNALISKRVLAFLIDIIIISLLILPAYLPVANDYQGLSFEQIGQKVESDQYLLMLPFYAGLIAFFYFTLLEYSFSQTFGKKAFGIYVVNLEGKMTFGKALLRSVLFLDIPFFGLLRAFDFGYALFNPNNQRLLEQFSKTKSIQFYTLNKEQVNLGA
ncbi:MAG TPA: RDD family protein [Candidatus Woesearchaeota archaeon]|nr:RDD family protein [Candidatus Woesearchaeota archaeon]